MSWREAAQPTVTPEPADPGKMMTLDLARWQFALTSINHFFFVPVTIVLAFLTAWLQTAWYRSGKPEYLRLTRFFGAQWRWRA